MTSLATESLIDEKLSQATRILDELGIDLWLTFVRETGDAGDPVLPIILGQGLTWQSALIVTRGGDRIAIVGKYEDDAVRSSGAWTNVIPYVEGISGPLLEKLTRLNPARIAINYSENDVKADGLTVGMIRLLERYLDGTPYRDRLESAEEIVGALRGRKTPTEVARLRAAIATTDSILRAIGVFAEPGRSEAAIAAFAKERARAAGVGLAWDSAHCPIVSTGPDSMIGHGLPSPDLVVTPGRIFHIDFGVERDDYCSDVQRVWYVPDGDESKPPPAVQIAFDTVVRAIGAAAAVLAPGIEGWAVDAAARRVIVDAGYPEYRHATGHHVGRSAHDGGGVLGPKWERYGDAPMRPLEAGNVVTLELGIENVDGRGYIGLEEMLLVTESGCEYLTDPQQALPRLGVVPERIC